MKRKNGRFLRIIALMCAANLSFSSLLPAGPGTRRPGVRSSRARQKPEKKQVQEASTTPIVPTEPITPQQEMKPVAAKKELREAEENAAEEVETETAAKKEAVEPPAPTGFFSKMYMLAVPLILVTLNEAMGTGIAAGTKNAIEGALNRRTFMNILGNAKDKATELVKTGKFDTETIDSFQSAVKAYKLEQDDPRYQQLALSTKRLLDLSPEEKKDLKMRELLAAKKIKDPEAMAKTTSISSIFFETLFTAGITMAAHAFAKILGYSITASLQTMMPEKN